MRVIPLAILVGVIFAVSNWAAREAGAALLHPIMGLLPLDSGDVGLTAAFGFAVGWFGRGRLWFG